MHIFCLLRIFSGWGWNGKFVGQKIGGRMRKATVAQGAVCVLFWSGLWFSSGNDGVQMHFREDGFVDGGLVFDGLLDCQRSCR